MTHLLDNLLVFCRVLRRAGVENPPGRVSDLARALECVDLGSRDEVYHACRALLVCRHDEIAILDRAFAAFWRDRGRAIGEDGEAPAGGSHASSVEVEEALALETRRVDGGDGNEGGDDDRGEDGGDDMDGQSANRPHDGVRSFKTWSSRRGLASKEFSAFTIDEIAEAREAMSRLVWNPGTRRTRRWARGRGPRIDLRRAMAESVKTGGDVVKLPRRRRRVRPRPLVLLCDVSGSMERYSRMLLHFAHTLSRRHRRIEVFLFSTTLTRITRDLRATRPDEALAAVARSMSDWSGGTRIGRSMKEFHQRFGRRALHGAPVVLIISDGWDCGEPAELAAEIARLQRSAHRLVWLNPLIGTPDYAPLTRGLRAALPFVDDFLPARTLTNLADLAIHLDAIR